MQIAVWSNSPEGVGVTSLSSVLATLMAITENHKTLLTHTLTKDVSMESYLLKQKEQDMLANIGESNIDGLFRLIKNGKLNADSVSDYCYSLLSHSNLDFLSTDKTYDDSEGFNNSFLYLNHIAKQFYDVIVTDVSVDIDHYLFEQILKSSDVLIVVGDENIYRLKELLKSVGNLKTNLQKHDVKTVLVVNKTHQESTINLSNHLKSLKVKHPFLLPYHMGISDSCNRNELVDYVLRQYHSQKKSDFNKYLLEVTKLKDYILGMLEE